MLSPCYEQAGTNHLELMRKTDCDCSSVLEKACSERDNRGSSLLTTTRSMKTIQQGKER
jgi:hypothetical protein